MAYFDRFDICEAAFVFAYNQHGGQWSREYKIFGRLNRLGFGAGASFPCSVEGLTANGKEIYGNFKRFYGVSQIKQTK